MHIVRMDLVLVIDVGSSFQKCLDCLCVPLLSSYPQRSALGTLQERMHKQRFTQQDKLCCIYALSPSQIGYTAIAYTPTYHGSQVWICPHL